MMNRYLKDICVLTIDPPYPNKLLREGSCCSEVARMQAYLNEISMSCFPNFEPLKIDGFFKSSTRNAVLAFQEIKGLKTDGIIGENTWNRVVTDYNAIAGGGAYVWPGIPLILGENSTDVIYMQSTLNAIQTVYSAIIRQTEDGNYDENMVHAVRLFQKQFNVPANGILGYKTWMCILAVYESLDNASHVGVTTPYPSTTIQIGSSGDDVRFAQSYLDRIQKSHGFLWPTFAVDGIFECSTQKVVTAFQAEYCLKPDGIIGPETWERMIQEFNLTLY